MMMMMMIMRMEFRVHRVVLGPKSPVLMTAMDKEEVKPMLVRDVDSNTMQVRDVVCETYLTFVPRKVCKKGFLRTF